VKSLGSVAAVLEAVREEAEGEAQRISREAEEQCARWLSAANAPAEVADREGRLSAARRQAAELVAREDWADRRCALEEREAWIARAVALGRQRLEAPEPAAQRRELLTRLATEAAACLPGGECEISVSAADASLLDEAWCRQVAQGAEKRTVRLAVSGDGPAGGCVARAEGGKVSFDNSFEARARRFEAAWRARLAEIYAS